MGRFLPPDSLEQIETFVVQAHYFNLRSTIAIFADDLIECCHTALIPDVSGGEIDRDPCRVIVEIKSPE